ncbi:MAG: CpaF family protein [Proteobacteria bacterium]|nr:CpaF family protein [Pseudomonadota bacterium]
MDQLRRELHERLLATLDFAAASVMKREQLVAQCDARVRELIDQSGKTVPAEMRAQLVKGVLDDVFGLGPLEPLFADGEITDILVVSPDRVFVERRGQLRQSDARFRDNAHLLHIIHRIVRNAGRRIDERSPMVDARLADGSRVNAIIPPLAVDGPQLSIRRFPERALDLDRLVGFGTLAPATAELLRAAVAGRLNIIFSGGAGVGKTTLLNAASASLGPHERVITIEDAAELRLEGSHIVRLETRSANVEGIGAVEPRDLLRNALRMRPDRIIVGECRGAEAFDMMQAMNTGHEGSMTTLHSNSARDAIYRLESMLAMGGVDMPIRVLRDYVASAIDMVVHLMRLPDGRRVIGEVLEVGEAGDEGLRMQPLHRYRVTGSHEGHTDGFFESTGVRPAFLEYLESRGIRIDPRAFVAGKLDEGPAT